MKTFLKILLMRNVSSLRSFTSSAPLRALTTGDVLREKRVFSSEDIIQYANVSCDANPLHFDSECARNAGFEDRLVHGMLVAGLFPRIISSHFPGAIYVSQSLHFRLPVYIGEEIHGEIINIRLLICWFSVVSRAKFSTKCFKDDRILVLDGEAMAILPSLDITEDQ
ncbi:hypothetical protein ACFE04_007033 [Oxalis oulophora]